MKYALKKWAVLFGSARDTTSHLEKWLSAIGGLLGILGVILISRHFLAPGAIPLIVASMGASAVLLFAMPHGHMSQPWPVIGGQLVSATIGVCCVRWLHDPDLAAALAVALAIGVMHYLRCLHPPGGATALTAVVGGDNLHALGFQYVLTPTLLNVMMILLIAMLFNYPFPWRRYPASLVHHDRPSPTTLTKARVNSMQRDDKQKSILYPLGRIAGTNNFEPPPVHHQKRPVLDSVKVATCNNQHGKYYSNGFHEPSWQVRKILAYSKPLGADTGSIHYQIIAGNNHNTTGTATVEDFTCWARYEVFPIDNTEKHDMQEQHETA